MTIHVDMPAIDAAINQESLDWLWDNSPELASAIQKEIKKGRSPEQVRRHVLNQVGPHRSALAWRCYQAAACMQNGGAS